MEHINQGEIVYQAINRSDSKQYLRDIGLKELLGMKAEDLSWLIDHSEEGINHNGTIVPKASITELKIEDKDVLQYIQNLPVDIVVVPYGAGSSYLGVLQAWWLETNGATVDYPGVDYEDETKNRKDNLWDDQYGVRYRGNHLHHSLQNDFTNLVTGAEELCKQATHGLTTWDKVFAKYKQIALFLYENGKTLEHIEIVVHDWLFGLDFLFPNVNCRFFIDMDFQVFAYTYFLAQYKHDSGYVRKEIHNVDHEDYWGTFRTTKIDLLRYWRHYKLFKTYILKQQSFSYDKIFYDRDEKEIIQFFEFTVPEFDPPADSDLYYALNLIDEYVTRNDQLIDSEIICPKWEDLQYKL